MAHEMNALAGELTKRAIALKQNEMQVGFASQLRADLAGGHPALAHVAGLIDLKATSDVPPAATQASGLKASVPQLPGATVGLMDFTGGPVDVKVTGASKRAPTVKGPTPS